MYFTVEKVEAGLEKMRNKYITLVWDKADGTETTQTGNLVKAKTGQFMLSVGDKEKPVFKNIPHNRLKKIRYNGQEKIASTENR